MSSNLTISNESRIWIGLQLSPAAKNEETFQIPETEIEAFDSATDAEVCANLNLSQPNKFWFILAQNRKRIFFNNKTARFELDESVCGCELRCSEWDTHRAVWGDNFELNLRR